MPMSPIKIEGLVAIAMHKKLFAVLLGGRTQGCHLELHDLVFVVGSSLEESYPRLLTKWFGTSN